LYKNFVLFCISGGARGGHGGAEPPPERFEPPLESFETRIEIRKSYVMSAFLGAQPPPEYFLAAEPPLELFSGSATVLYDKKYLKRCPYHMTFLLQKLKRFMRIPQDVRLGKVFGED
jgi:hypothetical protein